MPRTLKYVTRGAQCAPISGLIGLTAQKMFVLPIRWLEVLLQRLSNFSSFPPPPMFSAAHISVAFFPLTFAIRLWDSTDVEPVCLEIYIFLRIKGREGCTNIYRQNISKPDRRRIWEEKVAARINEEFFPLLVIIPLQIVHKSCNRLVKNKLWQCTCDD